MKNPFHLLNLPVETSDEMVESAYQHLANLHPEATSSQRAKEIEWAYNTIKHQRDRVRFQLFETPTPDIPTLLGPSLSGLTPNNPTKKAVISVLSNSLKGFRLPMPNTITNREK
jgi:hypothetical protein